MSKSDREYMAFCGGDDLIVNVTMRCNRGFACIGFMENPPQLIDVQDGARLYELLNSAKEQGPNVWVEYWSSK